MELFGTALFCRLLAHASESFVMFASEQHHVYALCLCVLLLGYTDIQFMALLKYKASTVLLSKQIWTN